MHLKEDGTLDPQSVDALTPTELNDWVRARLREEDTQVLEDPRQNVGQYFLVGQIYPQVHPETQANVRRIVRRFLEQLSQEHDDWAGDTAHSLLLLTMDLGERDLAEPVRRMAQTERYAEDAALHARLLQTLTFLGAKMPVAFWKHEAKRNPEQHLAVAFTGLLAHSPYVALGLLADVPLDTEERQAALYPTLRGLLADPDHRLDDIQEAIDTLCQAQALSAETCDFLAAALPELDRSEAQTPTDRYAEPLAVLGVRGLPPEPVSLDYASQPTSPDYTLTA
ncbi:MAG: hypothetical protein AAGG50_20440 [Bacteroidota bacterium]